MKTLKTKLSERALWISYLTFFTVLVVTLVSCGVVDLSK